MIWFYATNHSFVWNIKLFQHIKLFKKEIFFLEKWNTNPPLKVDIFQFSNPNLLSAPSYFMIVNETRHCFRRAKAEIRTKRIATTPKSDEKNCDYSEKADLQETSFLIWSSLLWNSGFANEFLVCWTPRSTPPKSSIKPSVKPYIKPPYKTLYRTVYEILFKIFYKTPSETSHETPYKKQVAGPCPGHDRPSAMNNNFNMRQIRFWIQLAAQSRCSDKCLILN